ELLFPHPRRLDVPWPLVAPPSRRGTAVAGATDATPTPSVASPPGARRIAVAVEQDERAVPFSPAEAESFGRRVGESAQALGASVATTFGPGCGSAVSEAYRRGLASGGGRAESG